jgi:hypothetical protein
MGHPTNFSVPPAADGMSQAKKPMGHPMQKTQNMGHPTADGPDMSKRPPSAQLSGTQKQP